MGGAGERVNKIIRVSFFKRDPITCARELIGAELIWGDCSGIVVEVEAYAAIDDEAAHTFTRPSARSFIERNQAGAAYVYFNYGMHWMLNVLAQGQANSRRRSELQVDTTKWICAPTGGTALFATQMWLSMLWRTRESVSRALRIIRGASRCATVHSLAELRNFSAARRYVG